MRKPKLAEANEKIAEKAVEIFGKIEDTVTGGYGKIEDAFVGRYLARDGETAEAAKERLQEEAGRLQEEN